MKDNYKIQDGCWNCARVFRREEYDEGEDYYCNKDKSKRPKCGSVAMNEHFDHKTFGKEYDIWEKWKENREVSFAGKCDKYEGEGK